MPSSEQARFDRGNQGTPHSTPQSASGESAGDRLSSCRCEAWRASRYRNGSRRTKAMRASMPCMPYRPQTRPRWNARRTIGARRPVGQCDAFRRSRVGLTRSIARLRRLAAIQGQHQNRHRAHYGTCHAHPRFAFVSNRIIHFSPFRWLRRIRRETYATISRRESPQANELRFSSS